MSDGGTAPRDVNALPPENSAPTAPAAGEGSRTRCADSSALRNVRRPSYPVKILFVSANAGDRPHLMLDKEYRAIEQGIRRGRHRDNFRLIVCPAARRSDLQEALLEHSPQVVHFACHGSRQGALSLLGDEPSSDPVSAASLAAMFEVLHDQLLVVVFNACFASVQASAVRSFAKTTIGMRSQVTDRASIAFTAAFYGALAYGRSVQESFDLGRATMDPPESQIPELFERTPMDAHKLHLVAHRRTRAVLLAALVFAFAFAIAGTALLTVERRPGSVPERRSDPVSERRSERIPEGPFVLDTRLRVQRQAGPSIMFEELRSGETLVDGDLLHISLRTSTGGYLYIAFCSQDGRSSGVPGLSVFPPQGGIRLTAGEMLQVPARLVVDDHPGAEALYLILSRRELAQADARLAEALGGARRERGSAECGARFRNAVARLPRRTSDGSAAAAVPKGEGSQGTRAAASKADQPVVTRGIDATWDDAQPGVSADENGVVVMRYEFAHVSRGPSPASSAP